MTIGAGTIYGSVNRGTSRGPGERVLWTYTGALSHGNFVYTYLAGADFYTVDTLAYDAVYTVSLYQFAGGIPGTNYAPAYFTLYNYSTGTRVAAGNDVKCNALIIGDSA